MSSYCWWLCGERKLSSIYLEWQIPRGANVAIYRFDGAMIVCFKKPIFVSITEIMINKCESISMINLLAWWEIIIILINNNSQSSCRSTTATCAPFRRTREPRSVRTWTRTTSSSAPSASLRQRFVINHQLTIIIYCETGQKSWHVCVRNGFEASPTGQILKSVISWYILSPS